MPHEDCEARIARLGYSLPEFGPPRAKFALGVIADSIVYLAGAGSAIKGKLGRDLNIESGYVAAREAGLQMLANLKKEVGSLDRVDRVLQATCMVNSETDFIDQPAVANGFTELMLEIFGPEAGHHARTAIGVASLPNGIAVEIDAIVRLRQE